MKAEFITACNAIEDLPEPSLPEAAVAGRSNCGKSSLINALTNQASLARTSSTPGRTQQIIFFSVNFPQSLPFHLVDLPGYGYAKASKTAQRTWGRLVTAYIDTRSTLRTLLILNDIRRTPGPEEHELLHWATQRHLHPLVILTKADKLNKHQRWLAINQAKRALELVRGPFAVSIHDQEGIKHLRQALMEDLTNVADQ